MGGKMWEVKSKLKKKEQNLHQTRNSQDKTIKQR